MRGIALSPEEIEAAPPGVRLWLEQEIACVVGRLTVSEPATRASALSSSDCNVEKASEDAGERISAVVSQGMIKMDSTKAEAIRNLIATRAYELWESEGQPHGRDLINWNRAENEIMSCMEDGKSPTPSAQGAQPPARSQVRRRAVT